MKFLISLLVFLLSTVGFTQNAESVLKSLQNKFDSITDLTSDISQKNNAQSTLTGKMYFKKDSNIRLELGNQTIVADGKTSWNYSKKNKKVIISDYDEAGSGLLSINYLVYQYPSECDLSLSTEGSHQILNLKPKSKKNNIGEVKLFISKENLIDKAVIANSGSGTMEVSFSNYKLNQNLSDSKFLFTAPEGTTVVDLR
jgi:outer membrane lipoprotein-sorting protein